MSNLLSLEDILDAQSWDPATIADMNLPPGFTRPENDGGKVSPFSKEKKGGFSYDYPKGSPFKMVKKSKSHGQKVYKDLCDAKAAGMMEWDQVKFPKQVVKELKKSKKKLLK